MPNLAATFMKLPTRSKIVLGISAFAVIGVLLFMVRLASSPSYTTLASGLQPADTGKVTAALDGQGIAYELESNGTAVGVEKGKVALARVALATAGVDTSSSGTEPGFELFDKQKLGASDFQQQVTYQRALEGEIARTIGQVQGVSGAQVQLVLPQDTLFADDSGKATAAVLLSGSGDSLEPGAVRGIAQLVANSVKDLKTADVTITSSTGQVLWPSAETGGDGTGTSKAAAEARYNASLEASLNALIAQTVGSDKARVQVHADLDVNKTTKSQVTVDGPAVVQSGTSDSETLTGAGAAAAAGGASGTGANIPSYSSTTTGANGANGSGSGNNYKHVTKQSTNIVPKTVTTTDVAPGGVNSLQVSLVLDKSVAGQKAALQAAVSRAAGLNPTRGDLITTSVLPFAKQTPVVPKTGPVPTTMLGPLKWVGLGLATLIFMFFMSRALKRREGETLAKPSWLTEIEQPTTLSQLEAGNGMGQLTMGGGETVALPPRTPDTGAQALEQLVDREPDRVAAQMRAWMAED